VKLPHLTLILDHRTCLVGVAVHIQPEEAFRLDSVFFRSLKLDDVGAGPSTHGATPYAATAEDAP
jgi:hypothetical protein